MLLLRLWNYLRGYVIIAVEGFFLEKFINICIRRNILLWDIKKHNHGKMTLKVSIDGFKMLRPIAKKTNCRINIIRKCGFPFVKYKYKKRKAFVIGALACAVMFYIMTSFVWTIEITGNDKLDTGILLDKLAMMGVKPGTVKYRISTKKIAEDMMMDVRELAWIGVTVKGTKVKIQIEERTLPPSLVPKDKPCDIIAKKDGIIKSIVSKQGFDKVKMGDTVKKGQILVSGSVPHKDDKQKPTLVHSISNIKARTWYEGECEVNTKVTSKERSGKSKDNYSLVLFTKKIKMPFGKVSYENYDKIEIKKRLALGEDLVFPFEFVIDRYYENNILENEINLDEAKQNASDEAYKKASEDIPETAEIVKSDVQFNEKEDGTIVADVTIECIEDIGESSEINEG